MDAGDQYLRDLAPTGTPIQRPLHVPLRLLRLPQLPMGGSHQQGNPGSLGVMQQVVWVDVCKTVPVGKLPAGAAGVEQSFVIGHEVMRRIDVMGEGRMPHCPCVGLGCVTEILRRFL